MRKLIFCLFFTLSISLQAQKLFSWKTHFSYLTVTSLTQFDKYLFLGTHNGLFSFHLDWGTIEKFSKINGFNDNDVQTLRYNPVLKLLMVVYSNGNIDVYDGTNVYNISDIYRKPIIGRKQINHIYFDGNFAYLSTSFGIVKMDLVKKETADFFNNIGVQGSLVEVFATTVRNDSLFAATSEGLKGVDLRTNAADFQNWSLIQKASNCSVLIDFNGTLVTSIDSVLSVWDGVNWTTPLGTSKHGFNSLEKSGNQLVITGVDSLYVGDLQSPMRRLPVSAVSQALLLDNGNLALATANYSLVFLDPSNSASFVIPNGPQVNYVYSLVVEPQKIWALHGQLNLSFGPTYSANKFSSYNFEKWLTYEGMQGFPANFYDVITGLYDKKRKAMWFGSYGGGIVLTKGETILQQFDETNSTLQRYSVSPTFSPLQISGIVADGSDNIWVTNPGSGKPLSVYTSKNAWFSFSVPSIGQDNTLMSPVVDDFGQVWSAAPKDRGIVVIKPGVLETPSDDLSRLIDDKSGNGGLPSRTVICLLKDENGLIWAGTEKGLSIFYSPGSVFTGSNFDSQRLIYGKGNNAYYLFDNERINCMALDPANRKWIGTPNGLWLLSADGNELLANFTRDNSPLLSNDIVALTVDPESGEVFVATDQGLLSLKGDAIVGLETKGDIEVFPNPVLSSYTGPIAIKNLVKDAYVKITDINGNLVFETRSNGGMTTWYGQRFDGQRVSTGVYLIFASYEDGTESSVGKVLVFH